MFIAAQRIDIAGHTVIPGLVDGHVHLPFLHKADIAQTGEIPPEEHTFLKPCATRACCSKPASRAASAEALPSRAWMWPSATQSTPATFRARGCSPPSPELTNTGNLGDERRMHIYRESIAMVVDGADEMQRACRMLVREGVDTLKLNISGNQTMPNSRSNQTIMRDDESQTAAQILHMHTASASPLTRGRRVHQIGASARVDIIYHCEYADHECLDLLEAARDACSSRRPSACCTPRCTRPMPGASPRESKSCGRRRAIRVRAAGVPRAAQARRTRPDRRRLRVPVDPARHQRARPGALRALLGYSDSEALLAATRVGAAAMMLEGQAGRIAKRFSRRFAGGGGRTATRRAGSCKRRPTSSS